MSVAIILNLVPNFLLSKRKLLERPNAHISTNCITEAELD